MSNAALKRPSTVEANAFRHHNSPSQYAPGTWESKGFEFLGFPGGAVVESPPANAGDTGSSPGLGGSHMPRSN